MSYLKFRADHLFDGNRLLDDQFVLITDKEGIILDIVSNEKAGDEVQTFRGILTPGLVNCHCHLELSHLKNIIPPHTGLIEFLCSVVTKEKPLPTTIRMTRSGGTLMEGLMKTLLLKKCKQLLLLKRKCMMEEL